MAFRFGSLSLILIALLAAPFLLVLWLILLFFNLIYELSNFRAKPAPTGIRPASGPATIVVLNWDGKELLAQGIPSILKAVQTDGRSHEILVVDNGSSDDSVEYLKENFPEVRIVALDRNVGFAEGNNAGVRAAAHEIVILLNNDMVVDAGFIAPLLEGFGPETFAVSSQIFHQDSSQKREETGKTAAEFRRGMIDYSHRAPGPGPYTRKHYPVFWAGGGSSAFHRGKFLSLGGFQDLYSPAYVEDTDISYQAWMVGWDVLFAPDSIVYHKHRASTKRRFRPPELQNLIVRNQFLFIWKNIRNWKLLLLHGLYLPWNCCRLTRDHGLETWMGILGAICALPSATAAKCGLRFHAKRSDPEIFKLASMPGVYFGRHTPKPTPQAEPSGKKPRLLWITAYLPHTGRHAGAGRMFQLLKRLSRSHQITLLTFLETDKETEFLPEVEPFCEKVIAMRRTRPLRWQLFAYEPFDEFVTPEMERAVDACFEESDFDLVQLEYTQMAGYAGRASGIPVLLTKHEVDFAACRRRARREPHLTGKLRWFYNYLQVLDREVQLTKGVDGVICMTDPDADELRKFCPSVPVHVINTGVDLDYFRPPENPAAEPRMIFVGAFQHLPNVEAMEFFCREVFPIIRHRVPEIELLIVGSNPPPSIAKLADIQGVDVTGFVPDIRPFMARSSIYVVPLRLGVGIRGKILEAWSMKMAVISTSVGCAGLRYENGQNLLIADSAEQFADQIETLVKDPLRRERLAEAGRKTAARFYGWDRSAQQLEAVYAHYTNQGTVHHNDSRSECIEAGSEFETSTCEKQNR